MRRLIESTLISLDGVVEDPGRWAPFDEEAKRHSLAELASYDAFLMGRLTFEALGAGWGHVHGDPYLDAINAMPKYVVSHAPVEPSWNSRPLIGDAVQAVADLKSQPGKDIIKYGTGRLDAALLSAGQIDEINLWVVPVVVGSGRRLFEGVDTVGLTLRPIRSQSMSNGTILTYAPVWTPR
jgi:dihydrofolate reductase